MNRSIGKKIIKGLKLDYVLFWMSVRVSVVIKKKFIFKLFNWQ